MSAGVCMPLARSEIVISIVREVRGNVLHGKGKCPEGGVSGV
jgi:hypothetical protein